MAGTAKIRTSNGSVLLSNITPSTAKQSVALGHAALTAGNKDFTDITLIAAKDAVYTAATSNAPVSLGIDHIVFKPSTVPEPTGY